MKFGVKIKNYPKYEVSNLGRIISYNNKNPRLLNGSIRCGYKVVDLWNEDGNTGNILLHRIVADASRELNIDKSKIAKVARNSMSIDSRGFVYNNFSAGGYKWKYI
ncbi:MAG: HNH endonuclease [Bacteriophage sp.]|nr:MAG: HNH endonuclease [Bacteriophage sp.]